MRALTVSLATIWSCAGLAAQAPRPSAASDRALRECATVAKLLVPPLVGELPGPEVAIEPAVIAAKERWRVVTLRSLAASDGRIQAVAREGADAHAAILDLATTAHDDAALALLAALVIDPAAVLMPLARAGDRAVNRESDWAAAVQRRRAAGFLLGELAREFAGPPAEKPVFAVDFDEHWFGPPGPDRVNLVNDSGRDLSTCTVQIDVRGKNGKWVRNVHFVDTWPRGKKVWADYLSVDPRDIASLAGTTAVEVQELAVSLWCAELRAEDVKVDYDETRRGADRLRQLDASLDLVLDYVHEPWFENGPCVGVTMNRGGALPRVKIELTCHGAAARQQLTHTVGDWPVRARVSVQSFGALQGCPASVDVTLTVDGLPEQVTRKGLKISARR